MILLDENVSIEQVQILRSRHIRAQHLGFGIGQEGMKDAQIIPFLLQRRRPTFFTLDADFYKRQLCHARYCLVYLVVTQYEVAAFTRRFLQHSAFSTEAMRMGSVVRVSPAGLSTWYLYAEQETHYGWL
jgi:hypothetical protein